MRRQALARDFSSESVRTRKEEDNLQHRAWLFRTGDALVDCRHVRTMDTLALKGLRYLYTEDAIQSLLPTLNDLGRVALHPTFARHIFQRLSQQGLVFPFSFKCCVH